MKAKFSGLRISSVLGVVPSNISLFDDELSNYSHDPASSMKLKSVMGYGQHRVVAGDTTTVDLADYGVKRLFERGILKPEDIDALFFVSQTPDYLIPPSSTVLHGRLNLPETTYCIDINDGCNGFIKGVFEAGAFLNATGLRRCVLVTGDVLSRRVSNRDRNSYPLVGDAVAITILERDGSGSHVELDVRYDGHGFDKLIIPAGGARLPSSDATRTQEADEEGNVRCSEQLRMNGRDVFAFTQTTVPRFIEEFFKSRDIEANQLDRLYCHQANAFILERLRKKLKVSDTQLPDKVVREYGNSSAATIPMSIAADGVFEGKRKIFACGFGVGLSWGGALFELSALDICEVIKFDERS